VLVAGDGQPNVKMYGWAESFCRSRDLRQPGIVRETIFSPTNTQTFVKLVRIH
jgi:hypothetical protein